MRLRFLIAALFLAGLLVAQSAMADDTLRGCLTGTEHNYILKTADGNLYRLHSDDDIKRHVGQMVEVKGHIDNKERDKEAAEHAAAARAAGVTVPTVGIDVHHIKATGGSCADVNPQPTATLAPGVSSTTTTTTTTTTTPAVSAESGVSAGVASGVEAGAYPQGVAREGGKYEHFTGCLTGTHDNYILRADDGTLYRLHSDKDIHEHVGDRVDVRGRIDNTKREREAQTNVNSEAEAGVQVPKMGINVEDLKTITRGCEGMPQ